MTFATRRLEQTALSSAALAGTVDEARPLVRFGGLSRTAGVLGDLLGAIAIVLCVPFVILAVGIPLVLGVRLLLWIGGLLL